jgi:hypothetical protein
MRECRLLLGGDDVCVRGAVRRLLVCRPRQRRKVKENSPKTSCKNSESLSLTHDNWGENEGGADGVVAVAATAGASQHRGQNRTENVL